MVRNSQIRTVIVIRCVLQLAVLFLCSENGLTQGFSICFLQEVSVC